MVDLTAEGEGESSEWGHMDNYIIPPTAERTSAQKARVGGCKDMGGGDKDWESEDD